MDHPAGVGQQVPQQVELGRRQVDRRAAAADLVGVLVQLEVGVAQHCVAVAISGLPAAAQDRPDPQHHLLQAERLGDVVVAADREPARPGPRRRRARSGTAPARAARGAQPPGTSKPSRSGSITSSTTRSGSNVRGREQRSRAGAGDAHVEADQAQAGASRAEMFGSSSTTRTRASGWFAVASEDVTRASVPDFPGSFLNVHAFVGAHSKLPGTSQLRPTCTQHCAGHDRDDRLYAHHSRPVAPRP